MRLICHLVLRLQSRPQNYLRRSKYTSLLRSPLIKEMGTPDRDRVRALNSVHLDKSEKYKHIFDKEDVVGDLKSKTIRGGFWSLISQVGSKIIQLASTIIIARILSPEDYGLVAKVAILISFTNLFSDMGFSYATIQSPKLQHNQVNCLFWINVIIGIILGLIIYSISPYIADFYNDNRLSSIAKAMALTFPINGIILQHKALLSRQMKFKDLAIMQLAGICVSVIVGIILALLGFGYWTIVIMQIAIPLSSIPFSFLLCEWRPSIPSNFKNMKQLLNFGMGVTGYDIVNYISRSLDRLLIGKFDTTHNLGLYDKAYNLMMLPILQIRTPINRIAIPALSAVQNDKIKFNNTFYRIVSTIAIITVPLACILYISSETIIKIILGNNWVESAPLFKILSIVCFLQPSISTFGIILISLGLSKRYFIWGCINSFIISLGFICGIQYGTPGICISYVISNIIMLIPTIIICTKNTSVNPWHSIKILASPMLTAIAIISLIISIRCYLKYNYESILCVVSENVSFTIIYLIMIYYIKNTRELLKYYYSIIAKKLSL